MKNRIGIYCITVCLVCLFLGACYNGKLERALSLSGDNRTELEKVLTHYKEDDLKYRAACFLIENMPGHSRYDSLAVKQLQPYYEKCREISVNYNWSRPSAWMNETNAYWDKAKLEALSQFQAMKADVQYLKADYLIREIDLAFKAWRENAYSRSVNFDEFCRYILPYRIHNGICVDDSRSEFYRKYAGWFVGGELDFRVRVDSLLYQYADIVHNGFAAASLPILTFEAFEYIKRGTCDDRCKFNIALLSALGMPIVQDFVPAWGNRSGSHSWNAVVFDEEPYAFEPFWDVDRWKYKRIYDNKSLDLNLGKFCLPKVYRHTYEPYLEGPLADGKVKREDIPQLFRTPWIKDVSSQYFQTEDVRMKIDTPIPQGVEYGYLCVFNHKKWIPVQWGKIEKDGKVVFNQMGKGMFYLPAFFQNGKVIPAADPFFLNDEGEQVVYKISKRKVDIVVRRLKQDMDVKDVLRQKRWLSGLRLLGCESPTDRGEEIYEWTDTLDMWNNRVSVSPVRPYRYFRLLPVSDSIALCELSFRCIKNGKWIEVCPLSVSGKVKGINKNEKVEMISDHSSATGFKGIVYDKKENGILFEMEEPCLLREIMYVPYMDESMEKGKCYELYYWDGQWIGMGKMVGEEGIVVFKDVPAGGIYWIDTEGIVEKVFIYEDGILEWH